MFGGDCIRRTGSFEKKDTVWFFQVGTKSHEIRVGSFIQLDNGDVHEVGYVVDNTIVTTQNKRFDILFVDVVLPAGSFSEVERILEEAKHEADAVNHPSHYTKGKFEVIEVIEEWTKHYDDGYVAYCVGNTMKYVSRAPHKHDSPLEDLKKARAYLDFAIRYLEKKEGDK